MLSLDVQLLREFFTAFFANPKEMWWRKFLAWDMTKPGQKPYSMSVFMILMFFRLLALDPQKTAPQAPFHVPCLCSLHDPINQNPSTSKPKT